VGSGVTVSYGTPSVIPEFEINDRVVLQPNTWYTCPAGKKARVKGQVQCTSRGAAATATITIAGIIMFQWTFGTGHTSGDDYINTPRTLSTAAGGQLGFFEVDLVAGDTIVTSQNSGTNAEFNLWACVKESPA